MDKPEAAIEVEVCYATPARQWLRRIAVPAGARLGAALEASGILGEAPEISLDTCRTGIHGKLQPLDTPLRAGDRIEIYRPLIADPMQARRRRAEKKARQ